MALQERNENKPLAGINAARHGSAVSTKHFRTLHDFARHRRDIELVCYCGHRAILSHVAITQRFSREGWAISLDAALSRFRCSRCGSRPAQIGPLER